MGRVYLDFDGKKWNRVEKSDFWMDEALLERLDNLKKIQKDEWDGVILIDGPERSGKSILGMLCGWYLSDCKLTKNNFALGLSDAAEKIASIPDKSVLIMDEGSTIFSNRRVADKNQKNLIEILDVVGQKNLFFIIILPCFFDLHKTIAVRRSKFLLHVYPDENYKRGRYVCWGESKKKQLYPIGKKNFDSYAYPHPDSPGEYPNFKPPFYAEYLKEVKQVTLNRVLQGAIDQSTLNFNLYNYNIDLAGRFHTLFPNIPIKMLGLVFKKPRTTIQQWIGVYNLKKTAISMDLDIKGGRGSVKAMPPDAIKDTFPKEIEDEEEDNDK